MTALKFIEVDTKEYLLANGAYVDEKTGSIIDPHCAPDAVCLLPSKIKIAVFEPIEKIEDLSIMITNERRK